MNRYPSWLNLLVLGTLLLGCTLALPNIYGTTESVQLINLNTGEVSESDLERYVAALSRDRG